MSGVYCGLAGPFYRARADDETEHEYLRMELLVELRRALRGEVSGDIDPRDQQRVVQHRAVATELGHLDAAVRSRSRRKVDGALQRVRNVRLIVAFELLKEDLGTPKAASSRVSSEKVVAEVARLTGASVEAVARVAAQPTRG